MSDPEEKERQSEDRFMKESTEKEELKSVREIYIILIVLCVNK